MTMLLTDFCEKSKRAGERFRAFLSSSPLILDNEDMIFWDTDSTDEHGFFAKLNTRIRAIRVIRVQKFLSRIQVSTGIFFLLIGILLFPVVAANAGAQAADQATRVVVSVYLDINGDKLMSEGEGIENLPVIADVDGQRQIKMTQGGQAAFSLPYANTENLRIEVPYLALADEAKANDKTGLAQVAFRLVSPELPIYLP